MRLSTVVVSESLRSAIATVRFGVISARLQTAGCSGVRTAFHFSQDALTRFGGLKPGKLQESAFSHQGWLVGRST